MVTFNVTDWVKTHEDVTSSNSNDENNDDVENYNEDGKYHEISDEQRDQIGQYYLHLFGKTTDNKSIYVKVSGFKPHFYVEIPKSWSNINAKHFFDHVKSSLPRIFQNNLVGYTVMSRHKFYYFTANELFNFIRFEFDNENAMRRCNYIFNKPIRVLGLCNPTLFQVFESNIEPLLRCMHIQNVNACGWIKIDKYSPLHGGFTTEIGIETDWTNLEKYDSPDISKLKIMSFDIECTSIDGSFPQAARYGDKIIQIGSTFSYYGSQDCYKKYILTLKSCDQIPGVIVESYEEEKDLLIAWTKLVIREDPDIITGYNIFGFDELYMHDRAVKLQCLDAFSKLGRISDVSCKFITKQLASSALGENLLKYFEITGRVQIDLMKVIQRDYKLDMYKLDFVSEYFISDDITNHSYKDEKTNLTIKNSKSITVGNYITIQENEEKINEGEKFKVLEINDSIITIGKMIEIKPNRNYKWCLVKDDVEPKELFHMQSQGPTERKIIAEYCVQDCALCNRLVAKLEILTNNIAMANVCHVPLSYIFLRGQGIKIFSLVAKKCREMNYCIPVIRKKNNEEEEEESYEGATVFVPEVGFYVDPIVVLDYNSLYPSSMIHKNISHETLISDQKYDNLENFEYEDIYYKNTATGADIHCRFARNKNGILGILPQILQELLGERKATKKLMEKETDKFKKNILDGKQLALKVTANSLYGQTGASTSSICLKEIAASTTATGRLMFKTAENFAQGPYKDIVLAAINNDPKFYELLEPMMKKIKDDPTKQFIKLSLNKDCNNLENVLDQIMKDYIMKNEECYDLEGEKEEDILVSRTLINKYTKKQMDFGEAWKFSIKIRILAILENKYTVNPRIMYGDSVTGDTPLLLQDNNETVYIKKIKSLGETDWLPYDEFKAGDITHWDKEQRSTEYKIWTTTGWSKIKRVIRHKTNKKIYRILTHSGCVEVTEDHSLLDHTGTIIKPTECIIDTKLMTGFPTEFNFNNFNIDIKQFELFKKSNDYIDYTDILHAQQTYYLLKSDGYYISIDTINTINSHTIYRLTYTKAIQRKEQNQIKKIELLSECYDDYVYDIETETGNFQAGVGNIIVKNTDSVFIKMNIINISNDEHLTDKNGLIKAIQLGVLCGDIVNKTLPFPHNLAYEKTLWPFCIMAKKRYVGNLYEEDPDHFKQKSMGIVLKRRDNAHIVKKIYGGIIKILLNERNPDKAIAFTKKSINDLMFGKNVYPMSDFVITKTLKGNYKNRESIAHAVLADKIAARDPGNKPMINERIPYVFIEVPTVRGKKMLQGDRIENPKYVTQNNLKIDYLQYLTNQIMEPVVQILETVCPNSSEIFSEVINKEQNRRKGIIPLTHFMTRAPRIDEETEELSDFNSISTAKKRPPKKREEIEELLQISDFDSISTAKKRPPKKREETEETNGTNYKTKRPPKQK